jgi:imidazolonepropionase-like amidohydrolase
MRTRFLVFLLAGAGLVGCAVQSPALNQPFSVRQVPYTPDSGSLAIRCGRLIDGVMLQERNNVLIVVRDGKIADVVDEAPTKLAALTHLPVLNLTAWTCLPGLIDMHTHLTDRPEDTADLRVFFTRTFEETERNGLQNASATLLAGFTTVRNVGTYAIGTDTAMRDTINSGRAAGPRMQVSGPYLTIPHGGGDLYVPDFQEPPDSARFHAGVARGPGEFRARARDLLNEGSDFLKVIASGAVLAFDSEPGEPEMTEDEIAAVVEVAHAAGKKVAAHAHGAESIKMALRAGADTIEHASYLDAEGIALARELSVALAMDIYNGDYIDSEGRRMNWPADFLRKNLETTEIQRRAFTQAVRGGVPIVFATDAAVFPHGLNARQFPIMVERGMTPMQAIQSATSVAAKYLGWSANVGSVETGKLADIIAVRGDPLADIKTLQQVDVVIKGGVIFKLPQPAR